ncbi:hypothetical protein [Caproiciproducens galactitolivorans]|uniref:ABC-2 family transporter protein n=1 Tax=Caproiciproducens galactitolivorans TaxID=642589 RepID=A0ABT4BT24_9FIRM|nr:hypothetical protein [Caproiciproducens galactitolivorans]MCY1713470.1 hypothetical protein [Caproiciproducens galactitolivorans]
MTSTIFLTDGWREFKVTFWMALKKIRGMIALLMLLMFIGFPMIIMIMMSNVVNNTQQVFTVDTLNSAYTDGVSLMLIFVMMLLLIFTVVIAVMLFCYLHRKRSVDLFHSLPIRRTPMLLGRYFAGLTALFAPILLNFIIVSIIGLSYRIDMQYSFSFVGGKMLWCMLMIAAALTFSVFMAVCTGTSFDMVISILGVNAAYPLLIYVSSVFASHLLPGLKIALTPKTTVLTAFSPFAAGFLPLFYPFGRNGDLTGGVSAGFLIWWILCTLILLGASIFLCRRRKSECAESNFAFPIPKIIIRFMVTAVSGIGFGVLLLMATGMPVSFFIGVISGSLAAHIVVEAVYSRGFQQMRKSFAWYGVFAASFLLFYGVLATGFFGYDTRVPNAAEVEKIEVTAPNSRAENQFYSANENEHFRKIGELSPSIKDKENIGKVLNIHRTFTEDNRKTFFPYALKGREYENFVLTYHLKNGGVVKRSYSYTYNNSAEDAAQRRSDEMIEQITQIDEYHKTASILFYLEPEYIDSLNISMISKNEEAKEIPVVLNRNEKTELLEALRKDCLNGTVNCAFNPYRNEENFMNIVFRYADPVTLKDGELKTLLGGYSGKINIRGTNNFALYSNAVNTKAVIDKYGWCKSGSTAK